MRHVERVRRSGDRHELGTPLARFRELFTLGERHRLVRRAVHDEPGAEQCRRRELEIEASQRMLLRLVE